MKGFNELKINIEELIRRYKELENSYSSVKEENERLEQNLDYLQNNAGEAPEINKKLIEERKTIVTKVNNIMKSIEEAKLV